MLQRIKNPFRWIIAHGSAITITILVLVILVMIWLPTVLEGPANLTCYGQLVDKPQRLPRTDYHWMHTMQYLVGGDEVTESVEIPLTGENIGQGMTARTEFISQLSVGDYLWVWSKKISGGKLYKVANDPELLPSADDQILCSSN